MNDDTFDPAQFFADQRKAIAGFVDATKRGDRATLVNLVGRINCADNGWKQVLQRLAKLDRVKPDMQRAWLQIHIHYGDHVRLEVGDDLLMIRALRVLLPPYRGPAVTLFRGDSFSNRCRRTYGLSWTSERAVAEDFANGDLRADIGGGSVLLQTLAPADAIICAPHRLDNRYGENEYLVDRRRLGCVTVLQRFFSHEEQRSQKR
jgi:hypothetical protein